jgi:ribonuclease HII
MKKTVVEHVKSHICFKKNFFEKCFWKQEMLVVGIDEVGRGCLAGPLVTAAVAIPMHRTSSLLKDSKVYPLI